MSDVFSAIADPVRRQIIDALEKKGQTVSELVAITGEGQPTVSKHLKTLREAGLVSVAAAGQSRVYSLQTNGFADVAAWISNFSPNAIGSAAGVAAAKAANELDAAVQARLGEAGEKLGTLLAQGATWLTAQIQEKLSDSDVDAKRLGRELGRQLADAKAKGTDKITDVEAELLKEFNLLKGKATEAVKDLLPKK